MSVKIIYDQDSRITFSGIECHCGSEHSLPSQDIYVGTDLLDKIPAYIRKRGLGSRCVLVADNITYGVAGRRVEDTLRAAGFEVITCQICRAGEMDPDERACGEVLLSMQSETEFLVSVGSGSLTDITRVVAMRTGKPFVAVGTAPSMDGYTSVVAPLVLRQVKIHRAALCPEIIVCDLDVLRTAPMNLVISGVGDVLGKYIARTDWLIGKIINDEIYCDVCGEIVGNAVDRLIENIGEIQQKSELGIRILIEALLLAGMTIMIVGHTRAVASIEHNIAHYWDMRQLMSGNKVPSHGAAVGVATLLVWPLYLRFAREGLASLDLAQIKNGRLSHEQRTNWMLATYGEEGANAIMRENPGDFLTWEEQERRIKRAVERFSDIRQVIAALPPFERINQAMRQLGAPLTAAEVGVDDRLRNLSLYCAKDYRTRYSLFKTLDECGLLKQYLADYPIDEGGL